MVCRGSHRIGDILSQFKEAYCELVEGSKSQSMQIISRLFLEEHGESLHTDHEAGLPQAKRRKHNSSACGSTTAYQSLAMASFVSDGENSTAPVAQGSGQLDSATVG